jgi:hypothetical protein
MSDTEIVYRIHPNGGVVFAFKSKAIYVSQIYKALSEAATWGEFRKLLPDGEWDLVVGMVEETHGIPDEFHNDEGDLEDVVRWDKDDAIFMGYDHIPQASDGDYPIWLQQNMDAIFTEMFLKSMSALKLSVINGAYWHIEPDKIGAAIAWLEMRGFSVEENYELKYF